jgi:asparagine synthase (glutamine-hydrolysing)
MRGDDSVEGTLLQPSLSDALRRQTKLWMQATQPPRSEREAHVQGLSQPAYQLALEMADKSAAAFGIEPRYPFFDRRLIEFCIGLPDEQKFAGGWPRLLLRRAMEGILPPAIQWRSNKANLSPNFHRRFRTTDLSITKALALENLSPYVRTAQLRDTIARYGSANHESAMNDHALALFRTTILGTWLNDVSDHSHRKRPVGGTLATAAA